MKHWTKAAILAAISASALTFGCQSAATPEACSAICAQTVQAEVVTEAAADTKEAESMAADTQAAGAKVGVKSRSEIDDVYKWKKDRFFATRDDFLKALADAEANVAKVGQCGAFKDAATLKTCLDNYFVQHTSINKLTLYSNMTVDTEPTPDHQMDQKNAAAVMAKFMEYAKNIRTELLKLDNATLDKYFAADADLKKHEAYIRNIVRRANRVLSDDAERVLTLAGDNLWAEIDLNEINSNSEDVFDAMLSSMDLPIIKDEAGKDVQLTLSNYSKYRRSADRNVRKAAVDGLMITLKKYEDVLANAYIGQIKNDVLFAKARKYDTALEAYLDKDNIPVALYHNLISTVGNNLAPLHRYVSLRKKTLGLDSVHLYDMYIPLTNEGGADKSYTYQEAVDLITTALAPLGEDYIKRLKTELDPATGSIDLLPHADKTSGAYSCSVYGYSPFVLMNYQDSLGDVSTLAHELGHSLHSIYAMESQPPGSYHYTMFLAEIASTTNESILNDYLYKNAQSDAEKINLLVEKLENIRGTIYRQTLFAEFEYLAHTAIEKGESINAEWLSKLYGDLIKKYYGAEYSMDGADDHEWAYIPHFYYKYYVYSYATGLSSALSFANMIAQSPDNAKKYIDMLKAGASAPSVDLLKAAGVDLTTPAPIEFALQEFDKTLTELEALLAK